MKFNNQVLAIAIYTLIAGLPAFAASPASPTKAAQDYKEGMYSQALTELQNELKEQPSNANAHYYSALCYQALSQIGSAKSEYTWVYANAKDNNLRYNSLTGLNQIDKWSVHRKYAGNGNNFDRGRKGRLGGGGRTRRNTGSYY